MISISRNIGIRLFQPLGASWPRKSNPFLLSRSARALLSFSRPIRAVWKLTSFSGFSAFSAASALPCSASGRKTCRVTVPVISCGPTLRLSNSAVADLPLAGRIGDLDGGLGVPGRRALVDQPDQLLVAQLDPGAGVHQTNHQHRTDAQGEQIPGDVAAQKRGHAVGRRPVRWTWLVAHRGVPWRFLQPLLYHAHAAWALCSTFYAAGH